MILFTTLLQTAIGQPEQLNITRLSRINETRTQLTVDTSVGPTSEVHLILLLENSTQVSTTLDRSDDSNRVFTFMLNFPLFSGERDVGFLFVAAENEEAKYVGEASIQFIDMDIRLVTVVGAPQTEEGSFLRVNCSSLDFIEVGGRICLKEDSPCYFTKDSDFHEDLEWCTEVENKAGDSPPLMMSICIQEMNPFTDIPEEFDPVILLVDRTNLNFLSKTNPSSIELLTVDPDDTIILSQETGITCEDDGSNEYICSLQVDIPEDKMEVNFIVVLLGDDGYVEASSTYPFKTFQYELEYLTQGAVYMSWTTDDCASFTITVTVGFDFNDIKFQLLVTCGKCGEGGDKSCDAFFVRLENGDVVSIQIEGDKNIVATTIDFPNH